MTFTFKTSKKSNNGTDVNAGQIPEILYRTMIPDVLNLAKSRKTSVNFALSPFFSKTITQVSCKNSVSFISRFITMSWFLGELSFVNQFNYVVMVGHKGYDNGVTSSK